MKSAPFVFAGLLAACYGAHAQQGSAQVPPEVATCVACHGQKGEGNAASNFPRLASQPQAYLVKQLQSYADGSRQNPVMAPIAKGLSAQQMQTVSAYYAALEAPATKAAPPSGQASKRAAQLANVGDEKISVQGCVNCHGPGGSGEPPLYPYLSGQHAGYLRAALGEWKSGARKTDPSMQMNMIANHLSDDDIAALSAYYAAQPAPVPEPQRGNIASGTPQRPMGPPSANAPAEPATGTGVEQGESTTGGSQGPGGANTTNQGPSGSGTGR